MRTQQEILIRFNQAKDFMGIQQGDLLAYMELDTAKHLLKKESLEKIESGEEKWDVSTDPKKEIKEYLSFAYEKAENQRGISASRSMLHFKTWIWLDDEKFYKEIIDDIEDYYDYGIPALDKIAKHYGYIKEPA